LCVDLDGTANKQYHPLVLIFVLSVLERKLSYLDASHHIYVACYFDCV